MERLVAREPGLYYTATIENIGEVRQITVVEIRNLQGGDDIGEVQWQWRWMNVSAPVTSGVEFGISNFGIFKLNFPHFKTPSPPIPNKLYCRGSLTAIGLSSLPTSAASSITTISSQRALGRM